MKIVNERFNAKWSEEKNRKIKKIKLLVVLAAVLGFLFVVAAALVWWFLLR
jgi:uncharacterized protein involved in exopolysaccharide biosynthesis